MARYLLGDVSDEQRESVEGRLAREPDYFEALCAFEDELILRWHRRELSAGDQRLFAEAYLASPARRARVEAARDLIAAAEELRAAPARLPAAREGRASVWLRVAAWLDLQPRVTQFALAGAAALVLVGLPVSLYLAVQAQGRLDRAEQEAARLQREVETAPRLIAAFALAPGSLRDGAGGGNRLRIPADADEVWLRFEIADPGEGAVLEAALRPDGTGPREPAGEVRILRSTTGAEATVVMPASRLRAGDYVLELVRREPTGEGARLLSLEFRVIRE